MLIHIKHEYILTNNYTNKSYVNKDVECRQISLNG